MSVSDSSINESDADNQVEMVTSKDMRISRSLEGRKRNMKMMVYIRYKTDGERMSGI